MKLEEAIEKLKDPKLSRDARWDLLIQAIALMATKIGMIELKLKGRGL